jgi:hypothetical protein
MQYDIWCSMFWEKEISTDQNVVRIEVLVFIMEHLAVYCFIQSIYSYKCSWLVDYNLQSWVVYRLFSVSIMLARNTFILIYCVVFHKSVQHPVACVIKVTKITDYATLCIVFYWKACCHNNQYMLHRTRQVATSKIANIKKHKSHKSHPTCNVWH